MASHTTRFFDRSTPPHVATLVVLAGVGAIGMNVFLPSLPGIARHFDAEYAVAGLAVSLYLAATGALQLVFGPLSDRYGRRPALIAGFVLMLVGSFVCLAAPTIEWFLFGRVVQGCGIVGLVVSRAAIRDLYGQAEAASVIGYVTMGMAVVPMLAPAIGGFLEEAYGWQASFWLMVATAALAVVFCFFDAGETNRHRSDSIGAQFRGYPELVRSRRFWGYCGTMAFASGGFFAFLGGAPYVAETHLGLKPSVYGLYFGITAFGYMAGNYITGRFARSLGVGPMLRYGNATMLAGPALSLAFHYLGVHHPAAYFVPLILLGVGNGMTLPSASAGMISVRPKLAGSAAGLGGSLQIGGGAALSMLAGVLLGPETGPAPLFWLMLATGAAAFFAMRYTLAVEREFEPGD
ncbi:MAG: multidrug effflux MFS transporter [Pseudomonadota bacterium]